MLGTNDLKEKYNKSPNDIAKSINRLIQIVKKTKVGRKGKTPKIILISPPLVKKNVISSIFGMKGAAEKSRQLALKIKEVAVKNDCFFIDISKYVESSKIDGVHLSAESHGKIAEIISKKIEKI